MSDPLPLGEKMLKKAEGFCKHILGLIRRHNVLFAALIIMFFGLTMRFLDAQAIPYALADTDQKSNSAKISLNSPFFGQAESQNGLFEQANASGENSSDQNNLGDESLNYEIQINNNPNHKQLAQVIYSLVGDSPIREMVPMISKRDQRVAAFLVGIAKKESSFGSASPSKNGRSCYNYWGLKGQGGQGDYMGYACFASPQEAVQTVGDKIEDLVSKDRTTPARMVDTWKCGSSCAGDPGAPSWVSTVALYFEKIVG